MSPPCAWGAIHPFIQFVCLSACLPVFLSVCQRELMSPARPIDRSRARLSAFTLAALEDSGWYKADYSDAEPLDWGRGAGCDFVLSSCWEFIDKVPGQPYFCGKGSVNQTRCTASAGGWGVCRSSAFTDSCLLVGKYSTDTAAAVRDDVAASGADGRAAACYSPPQLEALQVMHSGGDDDPAVCVASCSFIHCAAIVMMLSVVACTRKNCHDIVPQRQL